MGSRHFSDRRYYADKVGRNKKIIAEYKRIRQPKIVQMTIYAKRIYRPVHR